ncbi:D-sedoheptulose 7-phosphate isomerase [Endozoicomonas sp.]|uniref:D-sedoheptulose 7-phosphate isomerase n=1 Tax=Endozoicomonas sp. TaxID=1892382 RepID=UPI00383A2873
MPDYSNFVDDELSTAAEVLNRVIGDKQLKDNIIQAAVWITSAFKNEKKVISCGNGGSHCDAMHFAEELTGRYRENRPAYPAICISDVSHLTCVGNDFGFEHIFSRYLEGVGLTGDILLGISTSGNSINIVRAFEAAKVKGIKTILLTGKDGGNLASMSDLTICIPHYGFADRIQEIHIKVIHIMIAIIEKMMSRDTND